MNCSRGASVSLLLGLTILLVSVNCDFAGWSVATNGGDKICLMVEMDIKTNITYNTTDGKTVSGEYQIPNNATKVNDQASKCGASENLLAVTWPEGNSFTMNFTLVNGSYDLSSFVMNINTSQVFPDSAANQTATIGFVDQGSLFKIQGNFSYHCNRQQVLNDSASNNSIAISRVQFEAFMMSKTKVFSLAKDCDSNIKPDIVPIAVGLSLIALIVIVLIAYIVGRRRQQARGYLNIM